MSRKNSIVHMADRPKGRRLVFLNEARCRQREAWLMADLNDISTWPKPHTPRPLRSLDGVNPYDMSTWPKYSIPKPAIEQEGSPFDFLRTWPKEKPVIYIHTNAEDAR